MLNPSEAGDLQRVKAETEAIVRSAVTETAPVLIEAPPHVLDPETILGGIEDISHPITYLAPRRTFYYRVRSWVEDRPNITARIVPSPFHECPTFSGDNQGDTDRARQMYRRGFSGTTIHRLRSVKTPCHDPRYDGSPCRYLERRGAVADKLEADELDLLIGNHQHCRNETYIADRIVFLDRFNPSPFTHHFSSGERGPGVTDPKELVSYFLNRLKSWREDFPSETVKNADDLVDHREHPEILDSLLTWFENNEIGLDAHQLLEQYNPFRLRDPTVHRLGPLLTFAFLTMRRIDPQFEVAPPPEGHGSPRIRAAWEQSEVHPNTRCVRNRVSGEVRLLRPPDLEPARQVIGLDVLPPKPLWDRVFGGQDGFDHRPIIPRDAYPRFLSDAVNVTVRRVGRGRYPYVAGPISELDEFRFATIRALEDRRFPLISTKRALDRYRDRKWIEPFVKPAAESDHPDWDDHDYMAKSFGSARWSTAFEDESVGVVAGIPYPGHKELRTWAGFFAEAVEEPESGTDAEFDGLAADLYDHFVRNRLLRTILLFGSDDPESASGNITIYLITNELPAELDPQWTFDIERDRKATRFLEYLIGVARSEHAITEQNVVSVDEELDLHHSYIEELFEMLKAADLVTTSDRGRYDSTLYAWAGDDALRPVRAHADYTHALTIDDTVYLLSL